MCWLPRCMALVLCTRQRVETSSLPQRDEYTGCGNVAPNTNLFYTDSTHPSQVGHRALADLVVGAVWQGARHAVSGTGALQACTPGGYSTPGSDLERVRAALVDKLSVLEELPPRIVRGDTDTVGAACVLQVRYNCTQSHAPATFASLLGVRSDPHQTRHERIRLPQSRVKPLQGPKHPSTNSL